MRELLSINLFFIFLIFLNCTSSHQLNDKILKADSLILSTLNLKNLPGISVTILKDGINIYSKGFGYADIEKKTKIIPSETRFRIGSVSKTIASSALMKLVEEKKVNLDSSIYNYVPDYPKKRWEFTSRQIAGHLSGIRGYRDNEMMIDKNFTNVSDALEIFKLDTLMHEPNSKYLYSTHAWTLLSLVIENASGKKFLNYMQTNVFDLIDMKNTHAEDINLNDIQKVTYYKLDSNNNFVIEPYVNNSWKWAGGGFISTTEDVAKFFLAHTDYDYLTKESMVQLMTPQKNISGESTNYGIGWRTEHDYDNNILLGHTGGSIGGTTYAFMAPHSNSIIVMTTNLSNGSFGELPKDLFQLFDF